jgi:anaerobic selenocysteine-containing dehydrogenase
MTISTRDLGESICPYCGVGCRLGVEGRPGRPERIRGVADAPANLGRLCAKGALLGETIRSPDRLTRPLFRRSRQDPFAATDWDTALRYVRACLAYVLNAFGPDAVAFYGSGQLDTETAYLACKLFKGCLGTNNTDSNSRLCMAAAVAGYRSSLGSDGPPCCYEDIDLADVILILGSNTAEAHPVVFDRIRDARKRRPGLTLVVADPRRTPTAREADVWLPVKPGGDIALLNLLGRLLLAAGPAG